MSSRAVMPESLKQEIQALIAVNCREVVYQGKEKKEEAQYDSMKKLYHGSDSHCSLLSQFLDGKSPYDVCFNVQDIQNNREGNECRTNQKMLELKELLHCVQGTQFIVHEKGFTREALTKSRGNELSGRSLVEKYMVASRNYKMALKFANDYSNGEKGLKDPSGKTYEDMLLCVRQYMFAHFQGCKDQGGLNRLQKKLTAEHDSAVKKALQDGTEPPTKGPLLTPEDMHDEYFFTGYFAFVLYGPRGIARASLSCFTVDGSGIKKVGRSEQRKKDALEKANDREKNYCPDDFNRRGITTNQAAAAATFVQREHAERMRNINDQMFIYSTDHQNYLKELTTVNSMLENARNRKPTPNLVEIEYLEAWQGGLFDKLSDTRKRKAQLQEESDRLMKKKPTKAVTAYVKIVDVDDDDDCPVKGKELVFETPKGDSEEEV